MKVRIKFTKRGAMKFIGHLDIMRYFQKAMRRAEIDMAFSEGFSPHMIMSFAAPLGVGLTSEGEYMDIEIRTPIASKEAIVGLNAVMAEGMEVLSFVQIQEEKAHKAMSLVAAADYTLTLREGYSFPERVEEQLLAFAKEASILILKRTKKSEKTVDIRPSIYKLYLKEDEIFMQLATGSEVNLKPDLVMQAFYEYIGAEMDDMSYQVNRMEVYASVDGKLVSLESLGKEIE